MVHIATVDQRYQSYNVEMAEVVGGKFWKPYARLGNVAENGGPGAGGSETSAAPHIGQDPGLFEARPPVDLSNARLRKLAAALGPAYVRVSGTWANSVFFQDSDAPAPAAPPKGFESVLTRREWEGVVDFAHAVNAKIVTPSPSATASATRPACGHQIRPANFSPTPGRSAATSLRRSSSTSPPSPRWAVPLPAMTPRTMHGTSLSFANSREQRLPTCGSSVPDRSAKALRSCRGRCSRRRTCSRPLRVPSSTSSRTTPMRRLPSAARPSAKAVVGTTAAAALSDAWLARPDQINTFYEDLRDRFEPNKPSGLPRRPTPPAAAILGPRPFSTASAISISWAVSPSAVSRSSSTTRSRRATTA